MYNYCYVARYLSKGNSFIEKFSIHMQYVESRALNNKPTNFDVILLYHMLCVTKCFVPVGTVALYYIVQFRPK